MGGEYRRVVACQRSARAAFSVRFRFHLGHRLFGVPTWWSIHEGHQACMPCFVECHSASVRHFLSGALEDVLLHGASPPPAGWNRPPYAANHPPFFVLLQLRGSTRMKWGLGTRKWWCAVGAVPFSSCSFCAAHTQVFFHIMHALSDPAVVVFVKLLSPFFLSWHGVADVLK